MNGPYDSQFNLRRRHRLSPLYLALNSFQSAMARVRLPCNLDVQYGDSNGQKLDVFPSGLAGAPLFVFIHGGYFRALDKRQYHFIAPRMARSGFTIVLVNYDLAPRVRVAEIVDQVSRAFACIAREAHQWNGDPTRITLCGHSVGAFLAAKILEKEPPGRNACVVEKAILLSGLFDLGPMRQSYLNRDLQLSESDVTTLSPINDVLRQEPEILIAVGKDETDEFIGQSTQYAQKLGGDGVRHKLVVAPGINHYTMVRLLARGHNPISDWLLKP